MVNEALEAVRANLMRAVQKLFEQGNAAFAALRIYAMMPDVCERSAVLLPTRSLIHSFTHTPVRSTTHFHTPSLANLLTPSLTHSLTFVLCSCFLIASYYYLHHAETC